MTLARDLLEKQLINVIGRGVELVNKVVVGIHTNVGQRRVVHGLFGKQLTLERCIFGSEATAVEVGYLLLWCAGVDVVLILPADKHSLVRLKHGFTGELSQA